MPKSRRSKGKYQASARKRKERQASSVVAPQPIVPQPRAPSSGSVPKASGTVSMQYPYVTRDLIRVGIITSIVVVILVVLAVALS